MRRSAKTVAYDGPEDVPEEDAVLEGSEEDSEDNSNCSLFKSDDKEDN